MQSISAARTGSVTFEAYEGTPCGRLVQPGRHTGEAHYHDTYELLVVRAGSGTLACAGRSVTVTAGTSVLVAPGLVHSHARLSATEAWSVQFRAADVDLMMPLVDAHVGHFNDDTEREAVDAILAATLSGRIAPGPIARLQLSAIVAAFLGGPHSVPRACVGNPTVRAALTVIDRDYATLQGPSDVAGMLGKSLSYVTDLLREQTGYPMATWLREKRLFAASLLLAGRTPSIIDVALAVGYCDAGHFARQFVRRFGITPSAWRTQVASGSFAAGAAAVVSASFAARSSANG
jgi:AraC-like DNA-binding protein